jgi:4-amino-4-deoxy-L-arabinose transferase-like glycosyltransferase
MNQSIWRQVRDATTGTGFLLTAILLLGLAARLWQFGSLPPGLNQDEASIGVDAFNILHFGVDRHLVPWPVFLVSWGTGQNALYAYAAMPFIAVGGLTPLMVRLPMLVSAMLTLLLCFYVARRTFDERTALLATFMLAVCPWHVMVSRWALESNLLPFVFLLAYTSLLKATTRNHWFAVSCVLFALCLYAYGPAYVAVPLFLSGATILAIRQGRVGLRGAVVGAVLFAVASVPIALFLAVNFFHWQSVAIGPVTVPLLPMQPRYAELNSLMSQSPVTWLINNLHLAYNVLVRQTDGTGWNVVEPYGYFYTYTFPLAAGGMLLLLWRGIRERRFESWLLPLWVLAALATVLLQPVNINRINLIFVPLILCMAGPLKAIGDRYRAAFPLLIVALLCAFGGFFREYMSEKNVARADGAFFTGLLPAIEQVRTSGSEPICIDGAINAPWIFVLFVEKRDPRAYPSNPDYQVPINPAEEGIFSFGRYSFGEHRACPADPRMAYVLDGGRQPPDANITYSIQRFGNYRTFVPL